MEMLILEAGTASARRARLGAFELRAGRKELRCAACGYGVILTRPPRACPMCQTSTWDEIGWRPFSESAHASSLAPTRRRPGRVLMNALVSHGPGQKGWELVPDPAIMMLIDAVVRITSSTVCGRNGTKCARSMA